MDEKSELIPRFTRVPARVLGCLETGLITVIIGDGVGQLDGGYPLPLSVEMIPFDLRMPNSVFDIVYDHEARHFAEVRRRE